MDVLLVLLCFRSVVQLYQLPPHLGDQNQLKVGDLIDRPMHLVLAH